MSKLISVDPATGHKNAEVNATPLHQIPEMLTAARKAFESWHTSELKTRQWIIARFRNILLDERDEIARLITREMGRPLAESLAVELEACLDLVDYELKAAGRILKDRRVPLHNIFFLRRGSRVMPLALGVFGIISPWNWPLLIPLGCIVPALLAGNCVIHKHSEVTPLLSEKMLDMFENAGLPDHVFQIVQGDGHAGHALAGSGVDKIFFTGSTSVGVKVMETAAHSLTPVVLELGGQDAAIVCRDADIACAASGLVWGAFMNAGQNCNSVERIYVDRSVAGQFRDQFIAGTLKLRSGNGLSADTDMGPLATRKQIRKMGHLKRHARSRGARLLTGGRTVSGKPGFFHEPTVFWYEGKLSSPWDDEVFGPLVSITPFETEEEAVRLANANQFGLTASVWTKNRKKGHAIARRLETGTVMINDCIVSFGMPEAGWTGIKKSGIGYMHGRKGFEEMVCLKYVNWDPQYRRQKYWWFPVSGSMIEGMKAGMTFLYDRHVFRKARALPRVLRAFAPELLLNIRNKKRH